MGTRAITFVTAALREAVAEDIAMLLRHTIILLAAALGFAAPAFAQTMNGTPVPILLLVATSKTPPTMDELKGLIGHSVHDGSGNYIGSIEGIHIARDNTVKGVIVGLAQADGTITHDVALSWKSFQLTPAPGKEVAERVTVTVSPRILATLPAFQFPDPDLRGKIFGDTD
jgi:hypothetical protein